MKKGFTLIELLAVIVVLAIILVIAIPNVVNIINNSRTDAYIRSGETLANAARTYLTQNGITLDDGGSLTVTYTTLKTNNFIEPIKDISNGNECIYSKVYITRTGNNYSYKAGLVCDNYIDIETFDLLNAIGNFETDSNSDGLADGWLNNLGSGNPGTISTLAQKGKYSEKITYTNSTGSTIYPGVKLYKPVTVNNVYYLYTYANMTSTYNRPPLLLIHRRNSSGGIVTQLSKWGSADIKDQYQFLSIYENLIDPLVVEYAILCITSLAPGESCEFYCDNLVFLNLTAIYGAGNEPNKTTMDTLIKKLK